MLHHFLPALVWTVAVLGLTCVLLHSFSRLGAAGKAIAHWLCYAPGLDLVITIFTALPLIVGPSVWGWGGFFGALVGQYVVLFGWTILHELAHLRTHGGPKMYRVHNRLIGAPRNMLALIVTSMAAPTFWIIRITELTVYPGVVLLARLPSYRQRDWVNVTRHKFDGLVGHDRVWCLYCDWMTGIWSLGSEMLRNVESFWCPIRFGDASKCENCKLDFPDVISAWVPATGNVGDVVETLEREYESTPRPSSNSWFGHPARLTVKGQPPIVPAAPSASTASANAAANVVTTPLTEITPDASHTPPPT